MALSRRDEWLTQAEAKDPATLPGLLGALRDTSVPKLEGRLLSLALFPRDARLVDVAVQYFFDCPVRFREQLGTSVAAAGVAWLHGAKAARLRDVPPPKGAANEQLVAWHEHVTRTLSAALAHREAPPKPGTQATKATLPEGPRATLQAAWLERAKQRCPDDLPELLARLGDGPATDVTERAVMLPAFARDERIGRAAANLLERPPVKVGAESALFPVLALVLCVHGDRGHQALARTLASRIPSLTWLEFALPDVARGEAQVAKKQASPGNEADFLAAIAEAPADDARVALFTDWLLERGSPRGEFMALQRVGRPLTPKEQKRVLALQRKHEKTWLGSLARAGKGRALFRGGVLREVVLRCWLGADVPPLGEPQLATLEHLELDGSTNLPLAALLQAPAWRSLKSLTLPARLLAEVPAELLDRLEVLGVSGNGHDAVPLPRGLVRLRALHLRDQWAREVKVLEGHAVVKQLERLSVDTSSPASWFPFAAKVPTVDVWPAWPRTDSSWGYGYHFRRGAPLRVTPGGKSDVAALKLALAALTAKQRREVVLELPPAVVAELG